MFIFLIKIFYFIISEREKQTLFIKGDDLSIPRELLGRSSSGEDKSPITSIATITALKINNEDGVLPIDATKRFVGSEWPSWLNNEPSFIVHGSHQCFSRSRLTDPESHKCFVTSTSAGSSLCGSDDSNSSADDSDDEEGSKWIQQNAYNLTAFEQCEGAWRNEHPLPLPSWCSKIKKPLVIDQVSSITDLQFLWKHI